LTVNIEDSVPLLSAPHQVITLPTQQTNIMVVLDVSGSMGSNVTIDGKTMTRLAAAEQAVNTLLDTYAGMGNTMVQLVTFSTTANQHFSSWQTVSNVKSYLATLSASGGTNYDAALGLAETAFASSGKLTGANVQNVSYFLTDGLPTYGAGSTSQLTGSTNGTGSDQSGSDTGIQSSEEANWSSFLAANGITSYAFAMAGNLTSTKSYDGLTHTSQEYIDSIANGATGDAISSTNPHPANDPNAIVVTDWSQLSASLQSTVGFTASGSLMSGNIAGMGSGVGADGGYIHYVTVDGVTYTFDPTAHTIVTSNGSTANWNATTDTLTVLTSHGGTFAVSMGTGSYTYAAPASLTVGNYYTESIGGQLIDKDGDVATGTLYLDVARALGGAGNDTLVAPAGENMIIGGQGSDTMTGNAASDTFRWVLGDAAGSPTDAITNFKVAPVASGGDVLDLRDLLVGESHTGTDSGNLTQYLSFSQAGGNVNISVATHDGSNTSQTIVLQNVTLSQLSGSMTDTSNATIIHNLLLNNKLVTD
jgi:hypothetical protein